MVKGIIYITRFIVIALIYAVLFKIIKVMYMDLKGHKARDKFLEHAALEVIDAPENLEIARGSVFTLHTITNIGRNEDNSIIIRDPFVSSYHAKIYLEDDSILLEDLNSTNGTYINGDRLSEIVELEVGDVIEIGSIALEVIG